MNERRATNRNLNRMPLMGINNSNHLVSEGSEPLNRRVIPLKRTSNSINYFVGLISLEEHKKRADFSYNDEAEKHDPPPKELTPPYILCMNFGQVKHQDRFPEILDLSQDGKQDETSIAGNYFERFYK